MSCARLPGVELRRAATADMDQVAALNAAVHGAGVGAMAHWLASGVVAEPSDFWLAESPRGEVLSTLCLIPGELEIGSTALPYCEVGLVGTVLEWRGKGLCTALMREAHADALRRGSGLTLIAGIPYFYRRYGYDYAVPLESHHNLALTAALAPGDAALRRAGPADAPRIEVWAAQAAARLGLRGARRSRALLESLLAGVPGSETDSEFYLVDHGAEPLGYLRVALEGFGEGLIISEAYLPDGNSCRAALALGLALAQERDKPYLRLNLPASHPLVTTAQALGATFGGVYAWQAAVLDPLICLSALRPELEARLPGGDWVLHLDTYRQTYEIAAADGRLVHIGAVEREPTAQASVPPEQLGPLLLGSRSWAELAATRPDLRADEPAADLIAALWPVLDAWIVPQY